MGVSCLRLCLLHAMRLSLLVAALCLFAAVHCAHRVQIGSFEGEYTSPFGKGLFVCQNDDFVQGFMDEHLIFFGNTDPADGHHLEGVFYNAGTGKGIEKENMVNYLPHSPSSFRQLRYRYFRV